MEMETGSRKADKKAGRRKQLEKRRYKEAGRAESR
jgi:hypothetical protein